MAEGAVSANRLELLQIADAVAREKSIDKTVVLAAMEDAIQRAAKSRYGAENEIRAEIDAKSGEMRLNRLLLVVEKVENEATEISLTEANRRNPAATLGDYIAEPLPPIEFGRIAAQNAKQVIVQKVRDAGNNNVLLTDRGNTFGYQDLIVDYRNIPAMQKFNVPVVMDCTHSLQQPNQSSGVTGGRPTLIETIAKAGIAVGVDGLFIETHPKPSEAKSDGANMLPLDRLEPLLERLVRIREAIR